MVYYGLRASRVRLNWSNIFKGLFSWDSLGNEGLTLSAELLHFTDQRFPGPEHQKVAGKPSGGHCYVSDQPLISIFPPYTSFLRASSTLILGLPGHRVWWSDHAHLNKRVQNSHGIFQDGRNYTKTRCGLHFTSEHKWPASYDAYPLRGQWHCRLFSPSSREACIARGEYLHHLEDLRLGTALLGIV